MSFDADGNWVDDGPTNEWADIINSGDANVGGSSYSAPAQDQYTDPSWQAFLNPPPAPPPQYNGTSDRLSNYGPQTYIPGETPVADTSAVPDQPSWMQRTGASAANYAASNPMQILGMAAGAGMGLAGFAMPSGHVRQTPMPQVAEAQGMMRDQYGRLVPANQATLNQIPGMAANATAASNEAAPNVALANRKLTEVMNNPTENDPALVDALQRQYADKQGYYASRGMINSDIAQRDLANFQTQMQGALAQDRAQRQQIRVGTYSGAATAATGNEATAANTNTNMTYATNPTPGLSALANSGIQQANLVQGVNTENANLNNANRNAMFAAGGNLFGRSLYGGGPSGTQATAAANKGRNPWDVG